MLKTYVLAGGVMVAAASVAQAATVDFEGIGTGFQADGTSYSGLIFDPQFDIQLIAKELVAGGPGQDGIVARVATPPFGANPRGGSVGGIFDGFTVSSLSFVVGDSGGDTDIFRLTGLDADGNVVADSGTLSSTSAITVGITGTGIASFFLDISDMPDTGGSSVFDNIMFDAELAPIPLPATLPLLAAALGGLAISRARREKARG